MDEEDKPPPRKNNIYFNARAISTVGSKGRRLWRLWLEWFDVADLRSLHFVGLGGCGYRYLDFR